MFYTMVYDWDNQAAWLCLTAGISTILIALSIVIPESAIETADNVKLKSGLFGVVIGGLIPVMYSLIYLFRAENNRYPSTKTRNHIGAILLLLGLFLPWGKACEITFPGGSPTFYSPCTLEYFSFVSALLIVPLAGYLSTILSFGVSKWSKVFGILLGLLSLCMVAYRITIVSLFASGLIVAPALLITAVGGGILIVANIDL
jgi:hypothetical protein